MTPKAQEIKAKVDKWDYIKLKTLLQSKRTINKVKRHLQNEEIFTNYPDGRLISRIYKEFRKLKKNLIRL